MADRTGPTGRPTVAEQVRQPLLERLTREALDDDYRSAAERRTASDRRRSRPPRSGGAAAGGS